MSKKNNSKANVNEIYIAIILILIGIIIAITVRLDSTGIIGNVIRDFIYSLFSKLSMLLAFFLIGLGFYKIFNRENFRFNDFKIFRFLLISFLIILVYGFFNYNEISSYKNLSFNLVKDIINQSIKGENVGLLTFLIVYFIDKLIGKVGIIFLILGLFLLISTVYYRKIILKLVKNINIYLQKKKKPKRKIIKVNDINKVNNENIKKNNKKKEILRLTEEDFKDKREQKEDINEIKIVNNSYKKYILPKIQLLTSYKNDNIITDEQIEKKAELLEKTLMTFGVNARVENISAGPVIVRFELLIEPGTKVSKITSLTEDLALALAAKSIRIEAPIPGKSLIGIEIPNDYPQMVSFKDIVSIDKTKHKIKFCMGKDVAGETVISDISKMPHALIAGSTGSGKSVCINTLICSILFNYSPEDVKLLLIDPKVIELSVYNKVPHLVIPVVTDMKKAPKALYWCVNEMERRYKLFAEDNSKDLDSYNKKNNEKLPRLVIIIDELADLMMVSSKEVEEYICRLAQKARACGIHLIVATQRPSVDVITGLIKANIPTRIAFAVSSQVDSKTIIDHAGAEKLLGKGDMLYKPIDLNKPIRIQGAFISEEEVNKIVDYINTNNSSFFSEDKAQETKIEIQNQIEKIEENEDLDELFSDVIDTIKDLEEISVSLIQRRFRIGFNRASRIMDDLEKKNFVSASDGSKPRKVLIKKGQNEKA